MPLNIKDYGGAIPDGYDGPTWTTEQLGHDFIVHSFTAPYVRVTRKADGVRGLLQFTHSPRLYFDFWPDA